MMSTLGPQGLFIHNGSIHVLFVVFVIWRLFRRPSHADSEA
jgi:hypothetical protein